MPGGNEIRTEISRLIAESKKPRKKRNRQNEGEDEIIFPERYLDNTRDLLEEDVSLKPLDAVEKLRDSFGTEPEFEAHADTIRKRASAEKSKIKKNRDLAEKQSLMNN